MEFIIACPELGQPLESYSFEMDYPENKEDHDMTFNGNKITTLDNIKGHVIQLIRSLMQFSDTLSEVPSERVVNMKVEHPWKDIRVKHRLTGDFSQTSRTRRGFVCFTVITASDYVALDPSVIRVHAAFSKRWTACTAVVL